MISIDLCKLRKKVTEPIKNLSIPPIEETKTFELKNYYAIKEFLAAKQDGIFGIEYYKDKFDSKKCFFSNSHVKVNLLETRPALLDPSRKDVDCFFIKSERPNYMPFRFDMSEDLWGLIDKYTEKYIDREQIYLQVIFQKAKRWKQETYDLYNSYLDGIENPSSNRFILDMQYKLKYLLKDNNKKPYEFPEVIEKVNQKGFYVWQQLIILGNQKSRERLFEKIKLAYSHMAYANRWIFIQNKDIKEFTENVQLRIPNKQFKNILCVSEILPYFGGVSEVTKFDKPDIPRPSTLINNTEVIAKKEYKAISENDKQIIDDLEWAFQRVKLLNPGQKLDVVEVREGTTLKFITFMRPDGLKLRDIEKEIEDMELDLQISGLSIEPGTVRGSLSISIPKEERTFIQLESIMNSNEFKLFAASAELPLIIGVDMFGKPFFADLVTMVHILIAGTTGSGKSVFLNCLLVALTTLLSPQQLRLYLIDPKQVELAPYNVLPHVPEDGYTTDPKKARSIYNKIIGIMEQRYEELANVGVKNIAQYNKKHPKNKWDYIVVVTDEFADLVMQESLDDVVVRLGQKARACGIHLIMATQRPEQKIVSGLLKSNLPTKISFALSSHHDYQTVYGKMIPYRLLGKGDAVFNTVAYAMPNEFTRFQSVFADDDLTPITKKWGMKKKVKSTEVIIEQEPGIEQKPIDDKYEELKRIICETGESRLEQLRTLTKMNRTKLHEYMQQLIDEGWIEKGESRRDGYRLLLTDTEREEYLRNI